jgi:cell division protein FtsI (penicillin-binding protein 3)
VRRQLVSDAAFIWLARQTTPKVARAARNLDLRGIGTIREHKRYYPLGARAGQLLGFVGIDDHGLEGIEASLDDTLAGGTYELEAKRDARGRTIMATSVPDLTELQGNSVHLTIDERVQQVAERAVRQQVDKYNAAGGYAVAMDVHTGELLSIATTPKFNPNSFQSYDSEAWRLRPITDTFEPGSVFKSFVVASALDEGEVTLSEQFHCEEGRMEVGAHFIHDTHAYEELTVAEIIKKSSNIGAYKVARKLGRDRLYEHIREFGFGEPTGIGLRGEQPGLVWPPDDWAEVTFANIAFGQGLTATPLQVTTAMSAIANGGLLLEPRVVDEIRSPSGEIVEQRSTTVRRRVISEDAARQTTSALAMVPQKGGTGEKAALDAFQVAGKTGTAQKVNPETRQYDDELWVASFSGFVPARAPEVAISVLIDEPEDTHYGGKVAGPVFRKIARKALSVRGIDATKSANQDGARQVDSREIPSGAWAGGSDSVRQGRAIHLSDDAPTASRMPDLQGMSLKRAVETTYEFGVVPEVSGWGRVVSQDPAPSEPVSRGETVQVILAPARQPAPSSGVAE